MAAPSDSSPTFWIGATYCAVAAVLIGLGLVAVGELGRPLRRQGPNAGAPPIAPPPSPGVPPAAPPSPTPLPPPPAPPTPVAGSGGRRLLDVTTGHLGSFYRDHMPMQAAALARPYIGGWIKVSGSVKAIGAVSEHGDCLVSFEYDLSKITSSVAMWFSDSAQHMRLETTPRGASLAVVGKIREIGLLGISLHECEILDS